MKIVNNKNIVYFYKILIYFSLLFILVFLINTFFFNDRISKHNYDLKKDGVTILPSILEPFEIEKMKDLCNSGNYKKMKEFLIQHPKLNDECLKKCDNDGYIFQDYIWIIQKSVVHTCHRDNNGNFFNIGQKHQSYTILIYLEPMEKCLGVIPTSHLNNASFGFNIKDQVINLLCNPGDVIMFNANLIHVGAMNKKDDHLRCQMKISHQEDIEVLGYYQNFHKVLNQKNTIPHFLRNIQKRGSCALPIISNYTQKENIRSSRGSDNGIDVGIFQQIFSYIFYGNKNFYDLPNAF